VVAIAPGLIDTPMGERELERGGGSRELRDGSALGRAGRPEEINAVVDFVCSPAASFLTGTTLVVDGGSGLEP
jgi:NAD(P)-dependent dehydrogenase (short-subunit alcohol dehydrogenase family)